MKGLLFTYLLTGGGAAASLFNPWLGLLTYVCFAIIKPEALWYWSVPAGNYSRIVAIALLVGWALNGFGDWRFGRAGRVVAMLLGFLGWSLASTAFAADPAAALTQMESLSKIVLPVVVGLTLVDSVERLRQLAMVIVFSQGYVGLEMNLSYLSGFNRMTETEFAGMDNNCLAIAMVAASGLGLLMGMSERSWTVKLALFGSVALMAHSVMFAFSRGGMLGLIVTGFVGFLVTPKQPRHYAVFAIAILLAMRLAGPEVLARFSSTFADKETRDGSAQSRIEMWKVCVKMTENSPLFGVGPNNFPLLVHQYGKPAGMEAHSLWMQTRAEAGLPGVALLLGFYGVSIVRLWRLSRQAAEGNPAHADIARMVITSLCGFMVSAQFVSLEGLEVPYYVALIGAGALKLRSLEPFTAPPEPDAIY